MMLCVTVSQKQIALCTEHAVKGDAFATNGAIGVAKSAIVSVYQNQDPFRDWRIRT